MRTLTLSPTNSALTQALTSNLRADYVYMYPPRQAYNTIDPSVARKLAGSSLRRPGPLNLYVHVPFCSQICSYCNLYAVAGSADPEHSRYINVVLDEVREYADDIGSRPIDTLYIGGGTPSLLSGNLLATLTSGVSHILGFDLSRVAEVALEVSPETVSEASIHGFMQAGINRINLGAQTFNDDELIGIGRRYDVPLQNGALGIAMKAGFANVCVDLIYGLPRQTMDSWKYSLESVIAHEPQTICCYALTLRPSTGYAQQGYQELDPGSQYELYDVAHSRLVDAGYVQETHVRWIKPGRGGYRQKANHWGGQDIIGFGAGARSYLRLVDLRNGYSVRRRRTALSAYYQNIQERGHGITDGFIMSDEERSRKAIILGLGSLDRAKFTQEYGDDPLTLYPGEFACLQECGLITVNHSTVSLTEIGQRHRDVLVQIFFSTSVMQAASGHRYDD